MRQSLYDSRCLGIFLLVEALPWRRQLHSRGREEDWCILNRDEGCVVSEEYFRNLLHNMVDSVPADLRRLVWTVPKSNGGTQRKDIQVRDSKSTSSREKTKASEEPVNPVAVDFISCSLMDTPTRQNKTSKQASPAGATRQDRIPHKDEASRLSLSGPWIYRCSPVNHLFITLLFYDLYLNNPNQGEKRWYCVGTRHFHHILKPIARPRHVSSLQLYSSLFQVLVYWDNSISFFLKQDFELESH